VVHTELFAKKNYKKIMSESLVLSVDYPQADTLADTDFFALHLSSRLLRV